MEYIRSLNNNAAIAMDDSGKDVVIFGRGISFKLKKGDHVPEELIERIFFQKEATTLQQLVETIPQKYFDVTCEIIEYIQSNLKFELSSSLYLTLMDHIAFVKERADKGLLPQNSLKWEIRRYYPSEFRLGKKIVELLEEELECKLNDDEAASLALHIINAENSVESIHESMELVKLVDDIVQIICFQAGVKLEEDDLDYQRLITHIKFFIQRIYQKKEYEVNKELYNIVKKEYPGAYKIADIIKQFVESKLNCKINNEELTYLTIHTQRLIGNRKS